MSETIIIGEFTISKLRSGETVEFDNGVTVLPASDLATYDVLNARVAKLEALLKEALGWVGHMSDDPQYGLRTRINAALSETVEA